MELFMKLKIQRIPYKSLNRNEQYSFNLRILLIFTKFCGQFGKSYDLFKAAADELSYCMQLQQNKESHSLSALDKNTDEMYMALSHQVSASKAHPYPEVREAGQHVAAVFDRFKNPTRKTHDNAYGTLRLLIEALEELDSADLEKALVKPYIAQLKENTHAFTVAQDEILENKNTQKAHNMAAAVKACSSAWSDLADALESAAENNFVDGAADVIDQINVMNKEINIRLDARKTRLKKAREAAAAAKAAGQEVKEEIVENENIIDTIGDVASDLTLEA